MSPRRTAPLAGPAELVRAATVARLYFLESKSKSEIADELGINRFKVARILEQAQESGLVRIEISVPATSTTRCPSRFAEPSTCATSSPSRPARSTSCTSRTALAQHRDRVVVGAGDRERRSRRRLRPHVDDHGRDHGRPSPVARSFNSPVHCSASTRKTTASSSYARFRRATAGRRFRSTHPSAARRRDCGNAALAARGGRGASSLPDRDQGGRRGRFVEPTVVAALRRVVREGADGAAAARGCRRDLRDPARRRGQRRRSRLCRPLHLDQRRRS